MGTVERLLRQLAKFFADHQRPWALVGGLAVSVRATPRFTSDVDLAVAVPSDADAEALIYALTLQSYRVVLCLEHERQARLSTVRLLPPGQDEDGIIVDLLFASSGIEPELAEAAPQLNPVYPETRSSCAKAEFGVFSDGSGLGSKSGRAGIWGLHAGHGAS